MDVNEPFMEEKRTLPPGVIPTETPSMAASPTVSSNPLVLNNNIADDIITAAAADVKDSSDDRQPAPVPAAVPGLQVEEHLALSRFNDFLERNRLPDFGFMQILYQVHEDLRLVRMWTDVRVVVPADYSDDTTIVSDVLREKRIYLSGKAPLHLDAVFPKTPGVVYEDRTRVIVPMFCHETMPLDKFYKMCKMAVHPETGAELRCVTLALVDDDSTTAYYRTLTTWGEIVDPGWKVKKERGQGDSAENEGTDGSNAASEDGEVSSDADSVDFATMTDVQQ